MKNQSPSQASPSPPRSPHDSVPLALTPTAEPPSIPDHEVLRRIGGGSYGEVWLARNILGELRAIKVVYRNSFEDSRPFEREFEGIQKFEPISRSHPSQLAILHVGRNEASGYFYYVMELADDAGAERSGGVMESWSQGQNQTATQSFPGSLDQDKPARQHASTPAFRDPASYCPKMLRSELKQRGRLPPEECVRLGMALAKALEHLHGHGLVHRDIKPSNIIFVGGEPKLADIGLVTDVDASRSFVGTEGYLPPEGPGRPQADIYSLGKVLYELCTGKDRKEYPVLPADLRERQEGEQTELLELNAVLVRACAPDLRQRYKSADQLHADLALLERGESVRRKRSDEQRLGLATKLAVGAVVPALLFGALLLPHSFKRQKVPNPEVVRLHELARMHSDKATKEGKLQALDCINRALAIDENFAPGYATLLEIYFWGGLVPDQDKKIHECARKLMAIDRTLPEAHTAASWINFEDGDWQGAEKEIKLAIKLNPSYARAPGMYGFFLALLGRVEESHIQFKRAQELNPTSRDTAANATFPFLAARQFDQAITQARKALDLEPNFGPGHELMAQIYEEWGKYPEAIEEFERSETLAGDGPAGVLEKFRAVSEKYGALRQAYDEAGVRGYWLKKRELMESLGEFNRIANLPGERSYYLAKIHAHLAEKERALDLLKSACTEGHAMVWLKVEPCWDTVSEDPRFQLLLKQEGLVK